MISREIWCLMRIFIVEWSLSKYRGGRGLRNLESSPLLMLNKLGGGDTNRPTLAEACQPPRGSSELMEPLGSSKPLQHAQLPEGARQRRRHFRYTCSDPQTILLIAAFMFGGGVLFWYEVQERPSTTRPRTQGAEGGSKVC